MKYLNQNELARKYSINLTGPKQLEVTLNPNQQGNAAYLQDGIWHIKPELIAKIKEDVLFALNIEKQSDEAKRIKHRVVINNNLIIIDFFFPFEIK